MQRRTLLTSAGYTTAWGALGLLVPGGKAQAEVADRYPLVTPLVEVEEWFDGAHVDPAEDFRLALLGGRPAGWARVEHEPSGVVLERAFVYGSVAKAADKAGSDIDLMVVSDNLSYGDVFGAVDKLSRTLGRNVNPTVYSAAEFSKRAKNENAFITRVIEGPKLWVIGTENDLPVAA